MKFANMTAFVLYFMCAVAVWVLRKRDVRGDGQPFIIPGGPLIPIATCLVNAWMIVKTGSRDDLIGMAIAVVIALVLYAIRRLRLQPG